MVNSEDALVRLDSSAMWMVIRPGGRVLAILQPTDDEMERIRAAWSRRTEIGVERPDGYMNLKGSYRNELDEAAVLARWRATP